MIRIKGVVSNSGSYFIGERVRILATGNYGFVRFHQALRDLDGAPLLWVETEAHPSILGSYSEAQLEPAEADKHALSYERPPVELASMSIPVCGAVFNLSFPPGYGPFTFLAFKCLRPEGHSEPHWYVGEEGDIQFDIEWGPRYEP